MNGLFNYLGNRIIKYNITVWKVLFCVLYLADKNDFEIKK